MITSSTEHWNYVIHKIGKGNFVHVLCQRFYNNDFVEDYYYIVYTKNYKIRNQRKISFSTLKRIVEMLKNRNDNTYLLIQDKIIITESAENYFRE